MRAKTVQALRQIDARTETTSSHVCRRPPIGVRVCEVGLQRDRWGRGAAGPTTRCSRNRGLWDPAHLLLDRPVVKDQQFLSEVQAAAGLSTRKDAERWAKAVAGALADLAPDSQTRRRFISQLPRVLKSALQAQTRPALMMDREALIQHVGAALDVHAPDARRALVVVWSVIRRSVSAGEIAEFGARVPKDVAALLEAA